MSADSFPMPDLDWAAGRGFWDGVASAQLRLSFCAACGDLNWYPGTCRRCSSIDITWRDVGTAARLFTWTVVRRAFLPDYRDQLPLAVGLVVPDGAPTARVAMQILADDPGALRCDVAVAVEFAPITYAGTGTFVAPRARVADPGTSSGR